LDTIVTRLSEIGFQHKRRDATPIKRPEAEETDKERGMFKMGLITDQVSMDFEKALQFIKEQELEFVEIHALWNKNIEELDKDEVSRAKKLVDAHGLKVAIISSTLFLQCRLEENGKAFKSIDDYFITIEGNYGTHLKALERCISLADIFGCDKIRTFGFIKEHDLREDEAVSKIAEAMKKPVDMVERAGLTLVLENCPHTYLTYGSLTKRVIEVLGSKRFKALWDPGNALRSGGSVYPADYESVRPHIAHIHAKDLNVGGKPLIVPLGEGQIDYKGIFGSLLADGYDGIVSIEPEYVDKKGGRPEGCRRSIHGVRRILSSLGAST
jgi:L-ribulose-5-phosphate 3-epimerase